MRSSILFNLIILATGFISVFVKAGKVELTDIKLKFAEAVALNNIQSVTFAVRLNEGEPMFYCYSFWAQNIYEARDRRRGICLNVDNNVESLWFDIKSLLLDSSSPDMSTLFPGEVEMELYYFKTSQDNLRVIKVSIPGQQLRLDDLGSAQFLLKLVKGQIVEDNY